MPDILEPGSAEEAAQMMKAAAQQGRRVKLSARRLTRIDEYEPADLVISVQAGVTMAAIAAATRPHNQYLALDPAVREDAMVGDVVERGAAGPLRYGHGTPRDQVLGVEIVAGDGRILQFGGKVVKNVAGYDVVRLLVGSHGTLGFITRLHLRLKPVPSVDRTAIFAVDSFAHAADIADAIRASRLDAVALEIVSPPLAAAWSVLVRLHGNEEAVTDGVRRAADAALMEPTDVRDGTAVWHELLGREAVAPVSMRLANLPSRLRHTMAAAEPLASMVAHQAIAVHAGDGIVRLFGSQIAADALPAIRNAREHLIAAGGSLIVERTDPYIGDVSFTRPDTLELMQQIRRVFDPAGILAAGSAAP